MLSPALPKEVAGVLFPLKAEFLSLWSSVPLGVVCSRDPEYRRGLGSVPDVGGSPRYGSQVPCQPLRTSTWHTPGSGIYDKSACLSEHLNAVFPSLSKDDEHFSPEADAAMSEMTGNTALLAQVCSWWAGGGQAGLGLSEKPPASSGLLGN